MHPTRDGYKKQTEIYIITHGRAAILALVAGRPQLLILGPGDMAVMAADTTHKVMAVRKPYEHIVPQVPCFPI